MTWVRLDDNFPDHPKVEALSDAAFRLHVTAMCYSARLLTDGFVSASRARRLCEQPDAEALIDELVASGCWDATERGYVIHDFTEYNPTAEQVKRDREENARRQAEFRNRRRGGSGGESNAVTNASRNALVTPSRPVPGIPIEDKSSIGGADAPSPPIVQTEKPPKRPKEPKGVDLAPLFRAFTQAELPRPMMPKKEQGPAGELLKMVDGRAELIAQCWKDIGEGKWGDKFIQDNRSFENLLTRLQNWLDWKEGRMQPLQKPPPNGRPEPPRPDLPNYTGKPMPWEVSDAGGR